MARRQSLYMKCLGRQRRFDEPIFSMPSTSKENTPPRKPLSLRTLEKLDSIDYSSNVDSSDCDSPLLKVPPTLRSFDKLTVDAIPQYLLNKISTLYAERIERPIEEVFNDLREASRNAQQLGRDRQFAQRFTNILVNFNAIECASSSFADGPEYPPSEAINGSARAHNPDAFSAADKMARLVEILFYVTKNREFLDFC
ncbi:unnamed protein product [Bursaphelenchus xylophilus]|uniref:(pine wood nematode) hypothetical protein n=1 Tax=Bursaphelenchus xylophilus TaxID=6326 RepID=A0A1I7RIH1_BURXY|nr:unnamed protein product [Bursaphelenchus xylophilus]CAG9080765.1 unnamed protein product [Bursaphelenchus xylophilus]